MDMVFPRKVKTQFVTNEKGRKVAVVIPIKEYESIPWEQMKANLVADGILQD